MTVSVNGTTGITFNDASTQNTAATGFGFKNRIINGAMRIDQRNAGASVTPTTNGYYSCDRWRTALSVESKYSVQQSSVAPSGFINSALITSLSAYSVGATENFRFEQFVEGFNASDLGWGTANAQTVTLSFWVRSSLTGTFGGAFLNSAENRSYPFSYTISVANTWEQKSVTVAGDTSGTWLTNNGIGIRVSFSLGAGSSRVGTAGVWTGSFYVGATGQTNLVGTNGATFYITGVQLEKGSTATSFDYRPYGTELALCQRYYWKVSGDGASIGGFGSGQCSGSTNANIIFSYPVTMRTAPTIAQGGTYTINFGSTNSTVSAITAYTSSGFGRIDCAITGATTGFGAAGWLSNGTSNFITGSAEL
jgi:hypothetical protein